MLLSGQMVSCSLTIGHFLCQSSFTYQRNQVRAVLPPIYMSPSALLSILKLYSVSCLQSNSLTQEVQIKIRILALFFNQRYESGPKAVISTCSQVVSIILSGELSNSSGTLLLYSAEGTKIAFQVYLLLEIAFQVYLLLEYVGGPEKDQVFVAGQGISKFSLCIFFLLIVCLLA